MKFKYNKQCWNFIKPRKNPWNYTSKFPNIQFSIKIGLKMDFKFILNQVVISRSAIPVRFPFETSTVASIYRKFCHFRALDDFRANKNFWTNIFNGCSTGSGTKNFGKILVRSPFPKFEYWGLEQNCPKVDEAIMQIRLDATVKFEFLVFHLISNFQHSAMQTTIDHWSRFESSSQTQMLNDIRLMNQKERFYFQVGNSNFFTVTAKLDSKFDIIREWIFYPNCG